MAMASSPVAAALLLLALACSGVRASPPGPVVTCTSGNTNCTVTNTYGAFPDRSTCLVAAVVYPATEAEVLAAVSSAAAKKQHMKVVTVYSHSMPKLSCPGGPSGSGLVISSTRLNRVVSVDLPANRMTVEPGMKLRELVNAAAERGLAMPPTPYWQGMTIGGLLATGSHGSSLFGKGSAVHEYVVGMRIVVATAAPVGGSYAKVVDLKEGDEDLLAAKVSLGVLGVVTQITLQLQPMFKRSITYRTQDDASFESTIASFGATTEFGDITWYPHKAHVVYRDDIRLPITTPGKGINDFSGFRSQASILVASIRTTEETLESLEDSRGKCLVADVQVNTLLAIGQGLRNNDGRPLDFHGYPVIGNNSDMHTSGSCLYSDEDHLLTVCGWDPRVKNLFFHQTTMSIALEKAADFIADVKKLRDANPDSLCGVEQYSGFWMRYIRASTAYLGKTADSLDIDITYYRSRDPLEPRLHEDVLEEIEQMMMGKYGAVPHFGKNRPIAFQGLRGKLGAKADKFVEAMARFDPQGLFSSDWSDAVLGLRGKSLVVDKPGCALEGMCICSRDEHCAPRKGYLCRPGIVYTEARVCRKVEEEEHQGIVSKVKSLFDHDDDDHKEL